MCIQEISTAYSIIHTYTYADAFLLNFKSRIIEYSWDKLIFSFCLSCTWKFKIRENSLSKLLLYHKRSFVRYSCRKYVMDTRFPLKTRKLMLIALKMMWLSNREMSNYEVSNGRWLSQGVGPMLFFIWFTLILIQVFKGVENRRHKAQVIYY